MYNQCVLYHTLIEHTTLLTILLQINIIYNINITNELERKGGKQGTETLTS